MHYRPFGKLEDFRVSALGFGCMRLPVVDGAASVVDEPKATAMLRWAIENGVNYVDTAHVYHDGASERWLGRALADGYRERVKLATKMPTWLVAASRDFDRLLDEQLARLRTDRIDLYLLHSLHEGIWPRLKELGVRRWLDGAVRSGRVGAVGFSFHDQTHVLEQIIGDYDTWAMCQIQYNFMDEDVQAGTKGLEHAASRGLAVVVMEPLLGGALANPPPAIRAIWDEAGIGSPADVALRWLWTKPEVSVVLSGMGTMEQVRENVASAGRAAAGGLSAAEHAAISRVRAKYREFDAIPCTRCNYCMPCPNGVDIPRNLQLYNDAQLFGERGRALNRNLYLQLAEEKRAAACEACGDCEERCPQDIAVGDWMRRVAAWFGGTA